LPLLAPAEEEGVITARQQVMLVQSSTAENLFAPRHLDDPGISVNETPQGTVLVWPRRAALLELDRALGVRTAGPALQIDRQWLQLWLAPALRRDRLVARVAGAGESFSVTLPTGVTASDITVLVDGQSPRRLKLDGQSLSIEVGASTQDVRTLELWYLMPGYPSSLAPQQRVLELPRINAAATPAQCWLQVVTPASEQVLYSPSPVTPEQAWRKRGWLWKRAGALSTSELEAWSGAKPEELPSAEINEALFMTLGQPPQLDVVVWGSRWLWLCVAGGVLFAGMLAYYVSRGRLIAVIGGLAALALVFVLLAPELVLSVSQYAGVGLLLLVAVMWSVRVTGTQALVDRPATHPVPSTNRLDLRPDSRSARRGSSLTPSRKALLETTAEEARS
jgi:hypothetical protein